MIWSNSHMPQENEWMYGEVLKYTQIFLLKTLLQSVVLICCVKVTTADLWYIFFALLALNGPLPAELEFWENTAKPCWSQDKWEEVNLTLNFMLIYCTHLWGYVL